MPRRIPQPFWRKSMGCFYVEISRGKMVKLSADRATAFAEYYRLMAHKDDPTPADGAGHKVATLCGLFAEWCQTKQSAKTYEWYHYFLQAFLESIPPALRVEDLRPHHVEKVLTEHPSWKPSTAYGLCRAVQRVMNWAVKQGHIDRSPILALEKPAPESRDVVIRPAEFAAMLGEFEDQEFRDLLTAAWHTGARPAELMRVEARHVHENPPRWVFKIRESKGRKSNRVVYLDDVAAKLTERLAAAHPTGPLFRNTGGQPWTKSSINRRFDRKAKAMDQEKTYLYAFRHSFATRHLEAGADISTVAHWLGHDVATLARHYAHLDRNPALMRQRLADLSGATPSAPGENASG